jgi:hypothetical protein
MWRPDLCKQGKMVTCCGVCGTTFGQIMAQEPGAQENCDTYGAILLQKEEDNKWHPVAYLSKALTDTERNYNVHDKELKGIIGSLEAWQHYLEGASNKIEIWTDHQNLEYFKKAQKLSHHQARWLQYMQRFDYDLIHKPGSCAGKHCHCLNF